MSITTEIPESIQPPRQAATIASTTPATSESATTAAGPEDRRARAGQQAREEVAALAVEPEQVARGRARSTRR